MTLDTQLTRLDPARDIPDDLVDQPRARAALAAITAAPTPLEVPRRRPQRVRTWGAVAASALVVGGFAAAQVVSSPQAYAGWSAMPRPATVAEQERWGTECLEDWSGRLDARPDFGVRLVELRGPFAYAVLWSPSTNTEATCLMAEPDSPQHGGGFGFAGPLVAEASPRSIVTNSVRGNTFDDGQTQYEVTGKVGADVTAVVFDAAGTQVQATVQDGYLAAWWPGSTSLFPSYGPPNPDVTLTFTDGTSVTRPIQDYDVSPL